MGKIFINTLVMLHTLLLLTAPLFAMDAGQYTEFQRLMTTPLPDLIEKAERIFDLFDGKFQGNNYDIYAQSPIIASKYPDMPHFATSNPQARIAFRIAVKRPELLISHAGYCENLRLRNLLDCFIKGDAAVTFNEAAATCPACYQEAILIYLWTNLGATHGEISGFLRLMFDPSLNEPPPTSLN
jgi:hypothetical protein